MLTLLLAACATDPKSIIAPDSEDSGAVDTVDTTDTEDTEDTEGGDTGSPSIDSGPVPTAAEPFVVTRCGFEDGAPDLTLTTDRDGDAVEDLLFVVVADVDVWGTWLVPSSSPSGPYWDQPVHWAAAPASGIQTIPDLDGDGLDELFAYDDATTATQLLPDGTLGDTWLDVPARFVPWHDMDGDGRNELLVAAPDSYAADATVSGFLRLVSTPGVDPTAWTTLTTMPAPTERGLGAALALATQDLDGDGWPEVVVTDGAHGYLLSSAAIDAGATLADATLTTFADVAGLTPVPLGDVDGGGAEDFAFQSQGAPGYVWLFSGEAPGAGVLFENGYDVWAAAIGPDGAGGLALWSLSGSAIAYDLGDAMLGTFTRIAGGWSDRSPQRITASSDVIWVTTAGERWATRPIALRLDPMTAEGVLVEVEGGGPGYGGDVNGYGLDDLDGDGATDWWQLEDGVFEWAPVAPGTTLSVCDADETPQPDWGYAAVADDLDGDGVPEVTWWTEPDSVGLWSVAAGAIVEDVYDGSLTPLGCDLTGDGVEELVAGRAFQSLVVDGAAWVGGAPGAAVLAEIQPHATCVGDLNGDGIDELADVLLDIRVYDGASVGAGAPELLSYIDGPTVGRLHRLRDVDGDGLGDLAFSSLGNDTGYFGVCIATGAELLATPVLSVSDLSLCWDIADEWYRAADIDQDGVNEILFSGHAGLTAWWPATDVYALVWTPADDTREEPFLDVVEDAFGTGRAAVVLGPDPIVVYALGEEWKAM